jgi:hypothetical protein
VPPELTPFVNSARGVPQFDFWGAFTRLPTSTMMMSPDSLQRLHCYDDDMVDRRVHPPPLLGICLYILSLFTCSFFCQFFNMHVYMFFKVRLNMHV